MLYQNVSLIQPGTWFSKKEITKNDINNLLIEIGIYPEKKDSASKETALFILEQWIIQSQDIPLLKWTALRLLISLSQVEIADFISKLNKNAAMKLACLNETLMHKYIEYLSQQLDIPTLQWLYVVIESGTLPLQVGDLNIPEKNSRLFKQANQLIILLQVRPKEKFYLIQKIKEKLQIEQTHDTFFKAQRLTQLILETKLLKTIYPQIVPHIAWKKSYSNELNDLLEQTNTDEISWMLITLSTEGINQYTYLPTLYERNKLNAMIKRYERDVIIKTIIEILKKRAQTNAISIIENFYDNMILKLDNSTKKWLFMEMVIKKSAHTLYIPLPEKEQLDICHRLINIVEKSPLLWNHIHEKLKKEIEQDVHYLLSNIYHILCGIANQIPYKARLWHYVAITTGTENVLYDLGDNHVHENTQKNTLYRYIIPDITNHFIFLSHTSESIRSLLKGAIIQENNDPQFDKKIDTLSLYIKSFVSQQLKKLDLNAKYWLLYVLCFNTIPNKKIQLSHDFFINLPTGIVLEHANLILNQIYNNHEMRYEYTKQLLNRISSVEKEYFYRLINNYCKIIINHLNADEQAWLFITLNYFEINDHVINFNLQYRQPSENFNRIAKLLHMICLFFEINPIINDIKNYLIERNPSFQFTSPDLLDHIGNVIIRFISPNMLINLIEMNEEQSQKLAFGLSRNMPDFVKNWFITSLTSGCIDSKKIISILEQHDIMDSIKNELLLRVSSLLLLALRYESIKILLIEFFGGNKNEIKDIHTVKLNQFPLGDIGFSILCRSLHPKAEYLTQFSIKGCGLNDKSLLGFQNLLSNAPIKHLLFTNNQLSAFGYQHLLNNQHFHENPLKLATIIAAIIEEMQHTDEMTYLIANLKAEKIFGKKLSTLQRYHFNSHPKLNTIREMSNLLLDGAERYPTIYILINALTKYTDYLAIDTQLVYFCLSSQDHYFIEKMLYHIINHIQNDKIKIWIKQCLEQGQICISPIGSEKFKNIFNEEISQNELIQVLQIASILITLNADQRSKLYLYLGGNDRFLPSIGILQINQVQYSQHLQSTLMLGISQNINSLKYISLKGMRLSQKSLSELSSALKHNDSLRGLNLSHNLITDISMSVLLGIIKSHSITYLNLSSCHLSNYALEELLNTIPVTKIESLILKNKIHTSFLRNNPLSNINIKYLVELLKKEKCPLEQLDISHNKISTLGLKHLLKAISLNPNSRLTRLTLSPQENTDDDFEYILSAIEALLSKKQNDKALTLKTDETTLLIEPTAKKIIFSAATTAEKKSLSSSQKEKIIPYHINRPSQR